MQPPSDRISDRAIGRLLGDAREDAGLSQADAALSLGLPQSLVAKLETGARRLLLSEALRFTQLYQCELDAFNPLVHEPRPRRGIRRARIPSRTREGGSS